MEGQHFCESKKLNVELLDAVKKLDREQVYKLLSKGANINSINEEGDTLLHHFIKDGKLQSVKLLVEFGADTNLANKDGWPPMHVATFLGHRDMMLYLLMNGGRN